MRRLPGELTTIVGGGADSVAIAKRNGVGVSVAVTTTTPERRHR